LKKETNMSTYASYQHGAPVQMNDDERIVPSGLSSPLRTGGVTRVTMNGSESRTEVERCYQSSGTEGVPTTGFEATAIDPRTKRPTRDINDDTLITLGGTQGRAKDFYNAGLLDKDERGNFVSPYDKSHPRGEPVEPQAAPQETPSDIAQMPSDLVAALDATVEGFAQGTVNAAVASGIGAAVGDLDFSVVAEGLARNTGIELADAQQRVAFAQQAYESQVRAYLSGPRIGLDAGDVEDLVGWAQEKAKGDLKDAIQRQIYGQDMSGWRKLAAAYSREAAPTMESLQQAGFAVKRSDDGDEIVRVNGAWLSVKVAAKMGLI
jgi:hypothetical protein